ncbi:MAG: CoA-binding protein [Candidatus Rokubacteria bacterium]|nr:CoA-binding protein [Candidatus Rokubacteria bacterium]
MRDDEGLARVLREAKTIAILGAKTERSEPAFFVPAYLDARGYRVLPVNPALAGRSLWGTTIVATLADLPEPADVIEVFRRPGFLPAHVDEILVLPWRPQTVWLQLGIRHAPSVERLARAGIRVVENRCMMPEHRRLL